MGHATNLVSYTTTRGRYYGAAASPAHNARHPPRGCSQRRPSHVMMRSNGVHTTINLRAYDNLKIVHHCRHCSSSLPSWPKNHARRNPSRRRHRQNAKHTTINLGACNDSRIVLHYLLDTLRSSSITCVQSSPRDGMAHNNQLQNTQQMLPSRNANCLNHKHTHNTQPWDTRQIHHLAMPIARWSCHTPANHHL